MEKRYSVIVIGGGASGIIAAWRTGEHGIPTLLIEKNNKLGIKILISGGGKCNVTHAGTIDDLLKGFRKNEARFLKPAFYKFNNQDIISLLESKGVKSNTRTDGKVFPVSNRASDVLHALSSLLTSDVKILFDSPVNKILINDNMVTGIEIHNEIIYCDTVILATGGMTYPQTGTTGDGINIAKSLGHSIVPITPALAPMTMQQELPGEWSGIAVRNCELSIVDNQKKEFSCIGDLLFTHKGISGPVVLEISRAAGEKIIYGPVVLVIDFIPEKTKEELENYLQNSVKINPNKIICNLIKEFLSKRMTDYLLKRIGVDPEKKLSQMTRDERRLVIALLKQWEIGKIKTIDFEAGEVTGGGISLKEVDPKTMESKLVKGLFICGEVLDIAGSIGGYNLQAAFSTGYVAGEGAALENKKSGQP